MNNTRPFLYLLLFSNTLFLVLFLILSWHNRLAFDDFHFLWSLDEYGVLGTTSIEYHTWSTRWTAITLNGLVLSFQKQVGIGLFLFGLLGLTIFISSMYLLTRNLGRILGLSSTVWEGLNISLFIVSIIFIGSIKIDETWFLVCSSCVYLWSVMMLVLGTSWLFYPTKHIGMAALGIPSFIYLGGAQGPLALITLVLLGVGIYLSRNQSPVNGISTRAFQTRLVIAIIGCGTAFTILYFGPGNKIRESFFDEISVGYALILNIKMTGIIILKRLPTVLPFIAILCLPMIYIGSTIKDKQENWKMKLLGLTVIYFMLIYLYQLPITYKTQDVGAYRTLFPITILTIVYFSWMYLLIGKNLVLNKRGPTLFLAVPLSLSVVMFAYHGYDQQNKVKRYARSYDARMIYLDAHREQTTILELDALDNSGMLFTAELSTDTSCFVNLHLRKALRLSGPVRLKME